MRRVLLAVEHLAFRLRMRFYDRTSLRVQYAARLEDARCAVLDALEAAERLPYTLLAQGELEAVYDSLDELVEDALAVEAELR